MVSIKRLKQQIERERAKKKAIKTKIDLEVEKAGLQLELKKLQRKPSTSRNIKALQRTGRGLKVIGKKTFAVVKKQAILIKEQQLRDQALARKQAEIGKKQKLVRKVIITGKGRKRKRKVIFEKARKKVSTQRVPTQEDFFGNLPGLNI